MLQTILAKISQKRIEKNLSQYYMAAQLNISQGYYNKLESGKKTLSLPRILEIASLLEIDITELLGANSDNKSA
jgi:transcriptional regulator with XRE-family HTH domain